MKCFYLFIYLFILIFFLGLPHVLLELHYNGWKSGWKNCTLTSFMEYVVLGILISFNVEPVGSVVLKKPSHWSLWMRDLIRTSYMGYNLLTWLIRGYIIMPFSRTRESKSMNVWMFICMYSFVWCIHDTKRNQLFWALFFSPPHPKVYLDSWGEVNGDGAFHQH